MSDIINETKSRMKRIQSLSRELAVSVQEKV